MMNDHLMLQQKDCTKSMVSKKKNQKVLVKVNNEIGDKATMVLETTNMPRVC